MIIPAAITAPPEVHAPPPAAVSTGNWAGFGWRGNNVSATSFVVPDFPYHKMSAAEKNNHTVLSIWTGLFRYPAIEQIGIYDYVDHGHVNWAGFCAWWPTSDVSCGHGISTGDRMFLSVHRSGYTYTMYMKDAGPHNVWSISVSKRLSHADTVATAIAEDSTYPGYPLTNLTYFSPMKTATSPQSGSVEYFSPWGYAKKLGRTVIEILHR